jgi:hypothetical protein
MIALVIAGSAIAAAVVLAGGLVIGWGIHGLATANRCGCGHAFGCVDKYTGACTAQIRVRQYTQGWAKGWKYDPCPCRAHWKPTLAAAEPLDRDVIAERSRTS